MMSGLIPFKNYCRGNAVRESCLGTSTGCEIRSGDIEILYCCSAETGCNKKESECQHCDLETPNMIKVEFLMSTVEGNLLKIIQGVSLWSLDAHGTIKDH